jgi:hypothetical protein
MTRMAMVLAGALAAGATSGVIAMRVRAADAIDYRVLATLRTGTMEKELNQAADAGFRFQAVMGGETAVGGKEVIVIVSRSAGSTGARYEYKLLATNKTSTMEKELKDAGDAGYEVLGMTVGQTAMGGKELVTITRKNGK